MNILVTGSNGQLGTEIRNLAQDSAHAFIFTDISSVPGQETVSLDITDLEAVCALVRTRRPDVIINCAAFTDVAGAEDQEALAEKINCAAVRNLAVAACEGAATLIHVSTDYVFDGNASVPYTEDAPASPLGAYGRTKWHGEEAVRQSGCASIILRTAWLYSPYGRNFVKTVRNVSASRDEMKVVFDQVGSPTYAADLAAAIMHIIDTGQLSKTGVYHFTDEGVTSWYDFAKAIYDLSAPHDGHACSIMPCHTDEFPSKAPRPHYSVLDKTRFKETFGFLIPHWYDSLRKCINRL